MIEKMLSRPKNNQPGPDPNTLKHRNNAIKIAIDILRIIGCNPTRAIKGNDDYACCVQGGSACDAVGLGYYQAIEDLAETHPEILTDVGLGGPYVKNRKLAYKTIERIYYLIKTSLIPKK